jgi:hypothetical protein
VTSFGSTQIPQSTTQEPVSSPFLRRPLQGHRSKRASRIGVRGQKALMTGRPKLRTAKRKKDLSMSRERLKKAASSYDRLPLTPSKPPAAPTGIPAIQALSVPERRGNVAQVRRLIWKSFLNGPARGTCLEGRCRQPPEAPAGQTFFGFFRRADPNRPLHASLTTWNHAIF